MMADFKLHSTFEPAGDQPNAIRELVQGLDTGKPFQTLLGITGSGKTFTMANVIQQVQKPTLILSHNKTLAAQLYGEFKSLFPQNAVEFFISYYDYYQPEAYMPVTDTFIEKDSSIDEEIDRLRLRATTSLMSRQDVIIVSSVSCIYGIGSPQDYKAMLVPFEVGKSINLKQTLKHLVDIHYRRNDLALEQGVFRMRGDVLEVFPAYDEYAIRVDLFGDEIESIVRFNVMTGEVLESMDTFSVYPAKHFVTTRENINRALEDIRGELSGQLKNFRDQDKLLEIQRLEQRTHFDMEMMMELGYCSGIENYSRHLEGRMAGKRPHTLMDFFPKDFLMFIDESHVSVPQIGGMYNGDRSRKTTLVDYGFRLPSALDNRPMKFEEFEKVLNQVIFVSATPREYELVKSEGVIVEQVIRPTGLLDPEIVIRPSRGQIDNVIEEIKTRSARRERVLITTLTIRMAEDLTDYLLGTGIRTRYMHSKVETMERVRILRSLRLGEFDVLVGINLLREGLDLPEVSLVAVFDADKEGFLRSKTSLMQVAGRAARNVKGRVIFYADKITASMQFVIDETARRRKIQEAHNKAHNITAQTIYKSVEEIRLSTSVADEQTDYLSGIPDSLPDTTLDNIEDKDQLATLKRRMLRCAKELQFEQAAILRDKILEIESKLKQVAS
ncbi:MAG: excinuclease ABC subunit UvrB [Candidatus Marinimicrobia bacterium]|nr:excinuclease ABC subunit UvrB [Candidatus Neomarinimicrobiota bacterium]